MAEAGNVTPHVSNVNWFMYRTYTASRGSAEAVKTIQYSKPDSSKMPGIKSAEQGKRTSAKNQ